MASLNEEQINEILASAMEQIKAGVVTEAMRQATWKVSESLNREIDTIVKDFVTKEVAPELIISLNKNKSAIIEAGIIAADEMAKQLAASMAAKVTENLSTSYKRSAILKALFE